MDEVWIPVLRLYAGYFGVGKEKPGLRRAFLLVVK
jgi:hypothetical protein